MAGFLEDFSRCKLKIIIIHKKSNDNTSVMKVDVYFGRNPVLGGIPFWEESRFGRNPFSEGFPFWEKIPFQEEFHFRRNPVLKEYRFRRNPISGGNLFEDESYLRRKSVL